MTSENTKKIGKYTIRGLLGRGSMGSVYKVSIPVIEKIAALKLFKPSKALIEKTGLEILHQQFVHEAAVIGKIRHPHIAQIWSLEKERENHFYLMEYFCRNLGLMIGEGYWADSRSRIVPVGRASGYIVQILEGLCRLHDAGIIHSDLKPFNMMITDMGTIKIADFGLSRRRGETPLFSGKDLVIGTPFYSAPELVNHPDAADPRADLYSAGVILYRMLTGRLPKKGSETAPSQLNPMLDASWDRFLKRSLASRPADRFQSATEMSDALNEQIQTFTARHGDECIPSPSLFENPEVNHLDKNQALRSVPARILAKHAKKTFGLNPLHQPETWFKNKFDSQADGVVIDRTAGLVWQHSGSRYPLQWQEATAYVNSLNKMKFAGYLNWRLPTMEELMSLMNPIGNGGFCLEQIFSRLQTCLWSSDSRSKKAAWAVDLELGFVASSDLMDYHFVKGVCSLE